MLQVWNFNEKALEAFNETGETQPITGSLQATSSRIVPFAEVERNQFEQPSSVGMTYPPVLLDDKIHDFCQ